MIAKLAQLAAQGRFEPKLAQVPGIPDGSPSEVPEFDPFVDGWSSDPSTSADAGIAVSNFLPVDLEVFGIDGDGRRFMAGAATAATSMTRPGTGQVLGLTRGRASFVATEAFGGGFVCTFGAALGDSVSITADQLQPPNEPHAPDQPLGVPAAAIGYPIPGDTSPVIVGVGVLTNGRSVMRSQHWAKAVSSYSLPPNTEITRTLTVQTGVTNSTHSVDEVAKAVDVGASGGWGPVSASVSAALATSSSHTQETTVTESTTSTVVHTYANPDPTSGLVVIEWNLIDRYVVSGPAGSENERLMWDCVVAPPIPAASREDGSPLSEPATGAGVGAGPDLPPSGTFTLKVHNRLPVAVAVYARDVDAGTDPSIMPTTWRFLRSLPPAPDLQSLASTSDLVRLTLADTGALIGDFAVPLDGSAVLLDARLLTAPNAVPLPAAPTAQLPVPTDSPPTVVGIGSVRSADSSAADSTMKPVIVREQYWRKTAESFAMPPNSRIERVDTETHGRQSTSSDAATTNASLGMSAEAGWGPFSATVSAALSRSTSRTETVTVTENSTATVVRTYENQTDGGRVIYMWQLMDRIWIGAVPPATGPPRRAPVASVELGQLPLIPQTLELGQHSSTDDVHGG